MQSQQGDESAEDMEDMELSWQEDTAGSKETLRRHVDALLDISEENSMKELEPFEHNDPPGWEHAVSYDVTARFSPLSGLVVPAAEIFM